MEENRKFDWDFVKVQLRASYYGEAWGNKYRWSPQGPPELKDYVVKAASDFRKLKKLDPTKGVLGDQVRVVKLVREGLEGSVPCVQTVFSALTVAAKLAGSVYRSPTEETDTVKTETDTIKRFMKESPEVLHYGLRIISQTLADYAKEAIRAGADGIFLTTGPWSLDTLTEEEYRTFGKPYDLIIYEAACQEGASFNILHICRENIMLDLFSDYPVQVINYDALLPRNPSLKEAMSRTNKALWAGVKHDTTLLKGPTEVIAAEVHAALEQTGGRRFILGPGCCTVFQLPPDEHLLAAKEALLTWQRG